MAFSFLFTQENKRPYRNMQALIKDEIACTRNCAANAPQTIDPIKRKIDIVHPPLNPYAIAAIV
jgi:hypothetical protein